MIKSYFALEKLYIINHYNNRFILYYLGCNYIHKCVIIRKLLVTEICNSSYVLSYIHNCLITNIFLMVSKYVLLLSQFLFLIKLALNSQTLNLFYRTVRYTMEFDFTNETLTI